MTQLTTLNAVRSYLGTKTAGLDQVITSLIDRAGDFIQQKISRKLPHETILSRRFNGDGGNRLMLPSYPILSVELLSIDAKEVPVSDGLQLGYLFDDHMIYLIGGMRFTKGVQNVVVSWTAGFRGCVTETIPTGTAPTLMPSTRGRAVESIAAAYSANGALLTNVDSSPAAGQFTLNEDGEYGFNSADGGATVKLDYYFVPPTIAQACIELVGLKLMQRDKIGVKTKTLATESISFEDAEMTPSIAGLLSQYTKRTPN